MMRSPSRLGASAAESHPSLATAEPGLTVSDAPTQDLPDLEASIEVVDALWKKWRSGADMEARDWLIRHHLPYARMIAATSYARRTHNDIEFNEYMQLASIGLVEAVDRFDPAHGVQFKTFATKRVHGSILNGLVRLTEKNQQIAIKMRLRQERLEAAKEAAAESLDSSAAAMPGRRPDQLFRYLAEVGVGMALGVLLEDTGMVDAEAFETGAGVPSPEISYFRRTELLQMQQVMRNVVGQLSAQQKMVITYHYLQEIPFDEIAQGMGVTRGRISQLHRQGLLRLRELLSSDAQVDVFL